MSNNDNPPSNPSDTNPSNSNTTPNSNDNTTNTSRRSNTNNSNPNENANNSITSRIQSSASNLARSALSSTPADVSSSLPGATKPGSSRTGAGQAYYTETGTGTGSASASSLGSGGSARAGTGPGLESFRSTGSTGHEGEFEDAYSYGFPGVGADASAGAGIQEEGLRDSTDKGKGKELFEQVWTSTQRQYAQHGQSQSQGQQGQGQAQEDGADVLTLLSSPSFNPDFPDDGQDQVPNDLSDYQQDTGLSPEEMQTLDSFRRSNPPNQSQSQEQGQGQGQGQRITQNSLIPDIDNFLTTLPSQTRTSETELRDAVLTGLSGAEDWVAVEERYQDEVWGFLKPVLQAAAKEMEESNQTGDGQGQTGEDGPAVARLKMILKHMSA